MGRKVSQFPEIIMRTSPLGERPHLRHGHYSSSQDQDEESQQDEEILNRERWRTSSVTKQGFTVPIIHLLSLKAPQQPKKLMRIDPIATMRMRTAVLS